MSSALARGPVGAYQLQAAIATVHSEAPSAAETDWVEVLALYELLDFVAPNPMATVNRALAVAMVRGAGAGLAVLASLDGDGRRCLTKYASGHGERTNNHTGIDVSAANVSL